MRNANVKRNVTAVDMTGAVVVVAKNKEIIVFGKKYSFLCLFFMFTLELDRLL